MTFNLECICRPKPHRHSHVVVSLGFLQGNKLGTYAHAEPLPCIQFDPVHMHPCIPVSPVDVCFTVHVNSLVITEQ